ncbi:MAG TPA: hypothetical protein VFP53_06040 [Sphingomicrobium sp.]|nr:hypothetical protein [Sphingomicrobium sp.]
MSLSGLLAASIPFVLARIGWMKAAYAVLAVLLALSVVAVPEFTKNGLGPVMWFFVPFWSGWIVALVALAVLAKQRKSDKV